MTLYLSVSPPLIEAISSSTRHLMQLLSRSEEDDCRTLSLSLSLLSLCKMVNFNSCSVLCVIFASLFVMSAVSAEEEDDRYHLKNQCLQALQNQINDELYASLTYLNMAAHFHHTDVARKGFWMFFEEQSDEEKRHAHKLIHYINKRGGRVAAFDVQMPKKSTWNSAEEAVRDAIALEKELNVKLHTIHRNADKICDDPHLTDYLEENFIEEQISSISQLKKLYTVLSSFDDSAKQTGEYMVDKQLHDPEQRKYYHQEL